MQPIRVCANCRHLGVTGSGREFEKIADTEYAEFTCRVKGWTAKEFYLMATVRDIDSASLEKACEHWEEWRDADG